MAFLLYNLLNQLFFQVVNSGREKLLAYWAWNSGLCLGYQEGKVCSWIISGKSHNIDQPFGYSWYHTAIFEYFYNINNENECTPSSSISISLLILFYGLPQTR